MNSFNEKPTSEQLIEKLDDAFDIRIGVDVVHGLDFEYKQLQQKNQELKKQLDKIKEICKSVRPTWSICDTDVIAKIEDVLRGVK